MASKYVPPSKRKVAAPAPAPAPAPPVQKPYEEEFPTLGTTSSSTKVWGGTKTFAALAIEWDEKTKREAEELEALKAYQEETIVVPRHTRQLPRFHNVRRFVEEEQEEDVESSAKPENEDDQGWVVVDSKRRAKKRKTLAEIADEEFANKSDNESNGNTDSVWNNEKELHETCWDDRA